MRIRQMRNKIVGSFVMTAFYVLLVVTLIVGFVPNLAAVGNAGLNNQMPVAVAVSDRQEGAVGDFLRFDGSDSYDPDGSIASYDWDFGDGCSDDGTDAVHSFEEPGEYDVTLRVEDNRCGISIDIIIIIIIEPGTPPPCVNLPPVAVPTPPCQEVFIGDDAWFDGSCSYDPDGFIVSYLWDFGDGNTASGATATHLYEAPGRYIVSLTVTDDDCAVGSDFCGVIVYGDCPPPPNVNLPPVALPQPKYQEVIVGDEAAFDGSASYDLDGDIVSHEWDFGDGNTGSGMTIGHTYCTPGDYWVTLTVTDNDGAFGFEFVRVKVFNDCPPPPEINLPPVAVPEPKYQEVIIGNEAAFDGSASYDLDGDIVSHEWDFGDGNTGSGATVVHIYSAPGRYIVTLTVTDDDGAIGVEFCGVVVHDDCPPPPTENIPPAAVPEPLYQEVLVGDEATFDGSASYDVDGYIVSYIWDFGDGKGDSEMITTHAYDEPGDYRVTLTVTDDDGASTFEFVCVRVFDDCPPPPCENIPPVAIIHPGCQEIEIKESAVFDGSASYDMDGVILSYQWDFGDGTMGTGPILEHQYVIPGCYTVLLIVMDDDNATAITMGHVYVKDSNKEEPEENIPPTAVALPESQEIIAGKSAYLDGSESFDEDGEIVNYLWSPQWGTVLTGQEVSIPFENPGIYTVLLIVEDDTGAMGTDTATVVVLDPQPSVKPEPEEDIPDIVVDKPDIIDDEEPLLILTAGLINIATFREGVQRAIPVEVTSYHGDVHMVHIELVDDGGLDIEVIPVYKNVREGRIVKFYLRITVPELPEDTQSKGITLQLKAVGIETESNVEHLDILISEKSSPEENDVTETATTVGTVSAIGILGLLAKRRFL